MADERRTQEVEASPEEARFLRRFVRRTTLPWIACVGALAGLALGVALSPPPPAALSAAAPSASDASAAHDELRAELASLREALAALDPPGPSRRRAPRRRRGSPGEARSRARRTARRPRRPPRPRVVGRPDRDPRPPLQPRSRLDRQAQERDALEKDVLTRLYDVERSIQSRSAPESLPAGAAAPAPSKLLASRARPARLHLRGPPPGIIFKARVATRNERTPHEAHLPLRPDQPRGPAGAEHRAPAARRGPHPRREGDGPRSPRAADLRRGLRHGRQLHLAAAVEVDGQARDRGARDRPALERRGSLAAADRLASGAGGGHRHARGRHLRIRCAQRVRHRRAPRRGAGRGQHGPAALDAQGRGRSGARPRDQPRRERGHGDARADPGGREHLRAVLLPRDRLLRGPRGVPQRGRARRGLLPRPRSSRSSCSASSRA